MYNYPGGQKGLVAANFDTDLGFSNLPFEPALR